MGCCSAASAGTVLLRRRMPALQGHQLFGAFAGLLSERDHLNGHCTGGRGRPDRTCSTECTWVQVSCDWRRDRLGCPVDIQTRAAQNSLLRPCIAPALPGPPLRSPLCRNFWIWAWLYSANPSRASTTLQAREGHAGCRYELQDSASSKATAAGTPFNASASCTTSTLRAQPHCMR